MGTWNLPDQPGRYALKLKAIDLAGHQNETELFVSLPPVIDSQKGGTAFDEKAWIVIPPNSLPSSTVITVNEIDKNVYEFEPEVVFDLLKPATISISYLEEMYYNVERIDNSLCETSFRTTYFAPTRY